jgi:hypothetical protein
MWGNVWGLCQRIMTELDLARGVGRVECGAREMRLS